jgi:hypothetical protein
MTDYQDLATHVLNADAAAILTAEVDPEAD